MKNHSILIFGSSVRRDFDKYSDKDLLIAADSYERINELQSYYSRNDWSISTYTYDKLEYLAENGSLFIKHLAQEGKFLKDDNGRLNDVICGFQEKNNYRADLNNCINYFQILNQYPDTVLGFAWFCDCFYVGLRNYLIYKYAEKGLFEFSYVELLSLLEQDDLINNEQKCLLTEIRVVKRNYREEICNDFLDNKFICQLIEIGKQLNLMNSSKILIPSEYQEATRSLIWNNGFGAYQKLRLVEGIYTSQSNIIPELKKIISNPQFYSAKLNDNKYVEHLLSKLMKSQSVNFKDVSVTLP